MEKKKIILISIIVLVFVSLVIIILTKNNKSKNKENSVTNNNIQSNNIKSNYNNETGMYEIVDENSGEVITSTYDEESAKSELEFYKENPDYRANPPASPNAMNETFENEYNY